MITKSFLKASFILIGYYKIKKLSLFFIYDRLDSIFPVQVNSPVAIHIDFSDVFSDRFSPTRSLLFPSPKSRNTMGIRSHVRQ